MQESVFAFHLRLASVVIPAVRAERLDQLCSWNAVCLVTLRFVLCISWPVF